MSLPLFPEHDKPLATREEIVAFCVEQGLTENDGVYLFHHWEENHWTRNNKPLKKWKQAVLAWKAGGFLPSQRERYNLPRPPLPEKKCQFCGKPWVLNEIGSWVHQCKCFEPILGKEPF
jgi:hypothetical protein